MVRKLCIGCKAFARREALHTASGNRVLWTEPDEKAFTCWLRKSLDVNVRCRDVAKRPQDRFFVVQTTDEETYQKIFAARFTLKFEGYPVYIREWTLSVELCWRQDSQPVDTSWQDAVVGVRPLHRS